MTAQRDHADELIGKVLAERYQILERLGEGAMGTVYKARHIKVGRWFAVKVLHARLLADAKTAVRFEREAELAGRLRHANVVAVVDVGEVDGRHYMVMEFAEGPDLAELLSEAPMRPARIINLTRQILEGLYHAHEQGLIHRDLKPENVIIERDNHGDEMPRIVDFGIAILRDGGDSVDGAGRLTTSGLVLGTPHYMAPEQAVADPIDHRIDLFALGIVVYEMLSGQLPFDGSGAEIARANLMLDPPPIAARVPHLEADPLLEAFARRLMAKQPSARPATAKAARELLDLIERDRDAAAIALGVPTHARIPATTEPVAPQRAASPDRRPPEPRTTPLAATELASAPTRRLKVTPSPNPSVPAYAAPPSAVPPPSRASIAAGRLAPRDDDDWVAPPARNRTLIAAIVLGTAGIIAAFVVTRSGGDRANVTAPPGAASAVSSDRLTTAADPPSAAVTGAATTAAVLTTPAPPAPPARSPVPDPTRPSGATPVAGALASKRPRVGRAVREIEIAGSPPPGSRRSGTDAAASEVAPVDVKPIEAKPTTPATRAVPLVTRVADPTTAEPTTVATPPTTGVTASALASLYYAVPKALDQVPGDRAQDLRDRFRNFNVQALMVGPQAARDTAAAQLSQILREAKSRH